MTYKKIKKELKKYSSFKRKKTNEYFFKTGIGQYGEGDIFIGVSIPDCRKIAKKYMDVSLSEFKKLFSSPIHEEKMTAHIILILKFEKGSLTNQKSIYNFYIKNTKHINNWDFVDISSYKTIGAYLLSNKKVSKKILYKFARSKNLWQRRIAIISTYTFIRAGDYRDTLAISKILLSDKHDLIHKAVGWMLREVGKKSLGDEENFLKKSYKKMPRTMLRYATEKFGEEKRQAYLKGKI